MTSTDRQKAKRPAPLQPLSGTQYLSGDCDGPAARQAKSLLSTALFLATARRQVVRTSL